MRVVPDERARPGNVVTWAVDRVRADAVVRRRPHAVGQGRRLHGARQGATRTFAHGTTAQDVARRARARRRRLGRARDVHRSRGRLAAPADEGRSCRRPCRARASGSRSTSDPFITPTRGGAAPAFVTSFVRPDVHAPDVRVYVTLWDPRQIALHMEAGTVEPISANGEHGPGMMPRDARGDEARGGGASTAASRRSTASTACRPTASSTCRPSRTPRRSSSCATARTPSARGPPRPTVPDDVIGIPPEPHGARAGRQVQPVGAQLVGRHAARLARSDPHARAAPSA